MGNKSDALAAKFEQTSKDFQSRIEALTPQEWQAKTPEGWTVAACAHHAAIGSTTISMMASATAGKGPMASDHAGDAGRDERHALQRVRGLHEGGDHHGSSRGHRLRCCRCPEPER